MKNDNRNQPYRWINHLPHLMALFFLVFSLNTKADEITIDGLIFSYSQTWGEATLKGLSTDLESANVITVPGYFNINGKNYGVTKIDMSSSSIEVINAERYMEIIQPYMNFPSLKEFNIISTDPSGHFSENGIVFIKNAYYEDTELKYVTNLKFYPPSKIDETISFDSGVDIINLDGNKYLKKIVIGSQVSDITMTEYFPKLEQIIVDENNERLKIVDGGLYNVFSLNGTTPKYRFVHFPINYSDTFRLWEETYYTPGNWPNVKTILVDSPYMTMKSKSISLGDNVEELIFLKEVTMPSDWNSGSLSIQNDQPITQDYYIRGKNLKKVILPPNVGFSLSTFAELELTKSEQIGNSVSNKYQNHYYTVKYNPNLKYVGGGWLIGTNYHTGYASQEWPPYIGITTKWQNTSKYDNHFFSSDETTSVLVGGEYGYIYPKGIEIHLWGEPYSYSTTTREKKPSDLATSWLNIYYEDVLQSTSIKAPASAAGLKIYCKDGKSPNLSLYPNLKSLTLIYPDEFGGFGDLHFGNLFCGQNSTCATVSQSTENGSSVTLRKPSNLREVNLLGNVEYLPYGFFSNFISLESVSLPAKLISIGDKAFYGCSKLTDLKVYADYPPVAYDDSFKGMRKGATKVSVPEQSIDLYKTDEIWKDFFISGGESEVLTIISSIKNAGSPSASNYDLFGIETTLYANTNPGYEFIGWFDKNLRFISTDEEYSSIFTVPTTINAVYLPNKEADDIDYRWNEDNSLSFEIPSQYVGDRIRLSVYESSIRGKAILTEIFPLAKNKTRAENSSISISGLNSNLDYIVLIEILNENDECSDAYIKKVFASSSGISSIHNQKNYRLIVNNGMITVVNDEPVTITIYGVDGKCVYQNPASANLSLPCRNGIYLIKIESDVHKVTVK